MNLIEPEVLADLSGLSIGLCVVGLLLGLALWLLGWRRHRFWVVLGITFLGGRSRTPVNEVEGGKAAKLQWLLYSPAANKTLQVALESPNAGGDTTQVTLATEQGGAR